MGLNIYNYPFWYIGIEFSAHNVYTPSPGLLSPSIAACVSEFLTSCKKRISWFSQNFGFYFGRVVSSGFPSIFVSFPGFLPRTDVRYRHSSQVTRNSSHVIRLPALPERLSTVWAAIICTYTQFLSILCTVSSPNFGYLLSTHHI